MQRELEPATPAFESGTELPYALMRKMVVDLGLSMGADLLEQPAARSGGPSNASKAKADTELSGLIRFAQTQLMVEICRVNPGFALSYFGISPAFSKMGMRSSPTGAVYLDDVRVPAENLLGGGIDDRTHVRKSLTTERVALAAMSYGIAERCFEIALEYAKTRVQGGQAIAQHQLIQQRLARMYVALSNARRIVYDASELSAAEASAVKLYAAEVGTFVAMEAIHILGGNGYMSEYVVERLARDAKLVEIGGGTTEIQILTIAKHLLASGA